MLKAELRQQALAKRKAISEEHMLELNQKLLALFKTLDFAGVKSIHFFLPIVKKREPDTFLMIEWLEKHHPEIEIVVPKADFDSSIMNHYTYLNKEDLANNNYHIPEPQNARPFLGTPDMVIVPLLAFDRRGYRVGYGKGFYDRFLKHINTQKIGLSFFGPVTEIIDVHLDDIRLDQCITPDRIITF